MNVVLMIVNEGLSLMIVNRWSSSTIVNKRSLFKTVIPQKSIILGTNSGEFSRISEESVKKRILKKFIGNSSKKVTTVGEAGEIIHFCYLGTYKKCASDLQKLCIRPTKSVNPTYNWWCHLTYKKCTYDL